MEETQGISQQYYEAQEPPRKSRKLAVILVVLLLLLAVGFAASKFLGSSKNQPSPTPVPTQQPSPTEISSPTPQASPTTASKTPSATPKPTKAAVDSIDKATGLDRAGLSVEIQNGSGVAGVGAKASDFLSGLGYKIVTTGNADNFNYQNVTIFVKSSVSKYLSLLQSDLSKQYTVGTTSASLTSSSADALVIVGK